MVIQPQSAHDHAGHLHRRPVDPEDNAFEAPIALFLKLGMFQSDFVLLAMFLRRSATQLQSPLVAITAPTGMT
jgi:hypothetical protein